MAKDPGDKLKNALKFNLKTASRSFTNQIGGQDRRDLFRVTIGQRSSFKLNLTQLKTSANLQLLNWQGKAIGKATQSGKQNRAIATSLNTGVYYIEVTGGRRTTNYRLTVSTRNTAPSLVSQQFSFRPGTATAISRSVLAAVDTEQSASELTYTLTNAPLNGRLLLNGVELGAGGKFTQADVDASRLSYSSSGQIRQLTSSTGNETLVDISGANLVWNIEQGQSSQAYFYDGQASRTVQLTYPGITSASAQGVAGSKAVWIGSTGSTTEIFLFDAATGISTPITSNTLNEETADISGANLAWNALEGQTYRAFFYNGQSGQTTELTRAGVNGAIATGIDQSKVAWLGVQNMASEVFLFDAATGVSTQLTNSPAIEYFASVSGSNLIWNSLEGQTGKAFFYNGQTGQTIELTRPGISNAIATAVSGSKAIWTGSDGTDNEVFLYDAATGFSTQLTNNSTADVGVGVSGNNAVWLGVDGANTSVFFYDGANTTRLSDDTVNSFSALISGSNVAWVAQNGNNQEIVLRSVAASDRFSFSLSDGVGNAVNGALEMAIS